MREDELVTVIMPNRDHGRYLPRALGAILAQSWKNLEMIVVDDASTDDSLQVIADFTRRDARVRALQLTQHHGISRAVNAALATARGKFIYVAAADDFVAPNFLEHCVVTLNHNPSAGLSFSDPTEFYEDTGRTISFPLYLSEQSVFYEPATLAKMLRRSYFHISSNTCVYRISAFRDAGGYIPELYWLSDWFVTLVIALRFGVCYLPEQLTMLTVRSDSYSKRNLRDVNAQRALIEHALTLLALPIYADVATTMRRSALIPEYRLRMLIWLARNPEGRKFISPRLIARVVGRSMWSFLRPLVPVQGRRRLRQGQSYRVRAG